MGDIMKKKVFFICNSAYHLIASLYYGMSVHWDRNVETYLIWTNNTKNDINVDYFKEYFDYIFEYVNCKNYGFIKKNIYLTVFAGHGFFLSKMGYEYLKQRKYNIIVCFNDQDLMTNKIIRIFSKKLSNKIILMEEGVATYNIINNIVFSKKKILNMLRGIRSEPYTGHNKNISTFIVKNPEDMPKCKVKGKRVIKQNNFFCDDEWIHRLRQKYLSKYDFNIKSEKKIILWLGQPLEIGYLNITDKMRYIENILKFLKNKYVMVLKKHPRELMGKYAELREKYNLFEITAGEYSWFPVEIFARTLQPDIVLTPFSSAAYNIYQTGMKCKVIYCYRLFGLDVGNGYFDKLAEKNNIYNIKDLNDLQSALEQKLDEPETYETIQNFDIDFFENIK